MFAWGRNILLILVFPGILHSLAPRPLFSKKDGASNKAVVSMAALSIRNGKNVTDEWLNSVLYNGTAKVHSSGVIEIRYGTGRRSYTGTGPGFRWKLAKIGVFFPHMIDEDFMGSTLHHAAVYPIFERAKNFANRVRPSVYTWAREPDFSGMSALDRSLADTIMRGNPEELREMISRYPHKASIESKNGRTVYLRLDNRTKQGVSILRFKGVMPRFRFTGAPQVFPTPSRGVRANGTEPELVVKVDHTTPAGAMSSETAWNEYQAADEFAGDLPMGIAHYDHALAGDRIGFVVYGMVDDDWRVAYGRESHALLNMTTGEIQVMENRNAVRLFSELGQDLRRMHRKGWAHVGLHLGNVGMADGMPVMRDLEDARSFGEIESPYTRAAWRFLDVASPLYDWSVMKAFDGGKGYSRDFLEGYFGPGIPEELIREVDSDEFSGKMLDAEVGRIRRFSDIAPVLFRALIALEIPGDPRPSHGDQIRTLQEIAKGA